MYPPLCCPVCRTSLPVLTDERMVCTACGESYAVHDGLPVLIAQRFIDAFKATEQHFHDELSESARTGSVENRNAVFHQHFEQPMLDLPDGAKVLEVACGTRADGIEIARAGKLVTSLDLSLEAVERARQLAEQAGVASNMRFLVADAEHLPFADASFAATFVAASFHHFPNQLAALKEMKRVTKSGGYVIWGVEPAAWPYKIIYPRLAPIKRFIRQRRARQHNSIADDSTRGYTQSSIHQLFTQAGLTIIEIKPVKLLSEFYDSGVRLTGRLLQRDLKPWPPLDRGLSRIDARLENVPLLKKAFWHWNVISKVPNT